MADLRQWLAELSDLAAIDVCEQLAAKILQTPGANLDNAVRRFPPQLAGDAGLRWFLDEFDDVYQIKLPPAISVRLSRELLLAAAANPALLPLLTAVKSGYRDTKQFALEILALGAAYSMVIFVSTLSFQTRNVQKIALTEPLAKAIAEWFNLLKPWSGAGAATERPSVK